MATKVRLDELSREMLDKDGESIAAAGARELADRAVLEARAFVGKLQPSSPYAKLNRDQMIAEAARLDIRFGSLLADEDLRHVLEHARLRLAAVGTPKVADPAPPVPPAPPKEIRIRGVKPSPTNMWLVTGLGERVKKISVGGGQVTTVRDGKVISLRNYGERTVRSIVDQGVKLRPIEEPETED